MRKTGEIAVGLCFAVIGIVFVLGAVKLKVGVPTEPHPGFFPFVDGIILIALSVLFLFKTWGEQAGENHAFGNIRGLSIVVVTLVLYVAALEPLGYVITTAILSAVILKVLETKPLALVLVSVGLAIGSYLLFTRLLGVMLPPGLLTFW
jgi:putative tricarboxylic transport membrane protein